MNDIHSNASIKRASHVQRLYQFSLVSVCKGWIKLVLYSSVVGTVIGLNIVSVRRSSIKVLWCCFYDVLS